MLKKTHMRRVLRSGQTAYFVRHDGVRTRIGCSETLPGTDGASTEEELQTIHEVEETPQVEESDDVEQKKDDSTEPSGGVRYVIRFQRGCFPRFNIVR